MKNLVLVRHAKAEKAQEYESDFSRALIKKGIKDAKKIADQIRGRLLGKTLFIASNSTRAFETAHIFAVKLNYPITKILLKDKLYYDPSPDECLELVREIDDSYDTAVLFGHNPSLSSFASSLIKDFEFDIPTSGVVSFIFYNESWKDIEKESAIVKYAEYPLKKSEEISGFEKSIVIKISESISESLKNVNPDAARNILKSVIKHSAKLAENFAENLRNYKPDKKSKENENKEVEIEAVENIAENKKEDETAKPDIDKTSIETTPETTPIKEELETSQASAEKTPIKEELETSQALPEKTPIKEEPETSQVLPEKTPIKEKPETSEEQSIKKNTLEKITEQSTSGEITEEQRTLEQITEQNKKESVENKQEQKSLKKENRPAKKSNYKAEK